MSFAVYCKQLRAISAWILDLIKKNMTLLNQKKFKADLLIFKCLQGTNIPNFSCHGGRVNQNFGTRRNKTTLRIPKVRTEAAKESFWFQGPACFNELPIDIRSLDSIVAFKHKLKELLKGL